MPLIGFAYPYFSCENDIPNLAGKVIIVTGGNSGLGKASVLELAKHNPAHIYMSARSAAKAQKAIDEIVTALPAASKSVPISFLKCDLSSLDSVQAAARDFVRQSDRLDILMLNAGIMATPPSVSADGYEIQFATNHLGHALLAKLLMPTLEKTEGSRIVSLTSEGEQLADPVGTIPFDKLKTGLADVEKGVLGANWTRYGLSKAANIMYTRQLAVHHPKVLSLSIHPGAWVQTEIDSDVNLEESNFLAKLFLRIDKFRSSTPLAEGVKSQIWGAVVARSEVTNGEYYKPVGKPGKKFSKQVNDEKLTVELWDWTEEQLKGRTL